MFGCYRKGDANDPETYCAAVTAVLAQYPPDVVRLVTDPRSGLASRQEFLPTVKEVRDACEAIVQAEARAYRQKQDYARQMHERRALDEKYKNQPKIDFAARYGQNYGLSSAPGKKSEESKAERQAALADANKRTFAAECEAAGLDPETTAISPSLAALLRRHSPAA